MSEIISKENIAQRELSRAEKISLAHKLARERLSSEFNLQMGDKVCIDPAQFSEATYKFYKLGRKVGKIIGVQQVSSLLLYVIFRNRTKNEDGKVVIETFKESAHILKKIN